MYLLILLTIAQITLLLGSYHAGVPISLTSLLFTNEPTMVLSL